MAPPQDRLLVALFAGLTACSYYDSSLLEPAGVAGGAGDGGSDVVSEQDPDSADDVAPDHDAGTGCVHALPPEPPLVKDAGGGVTFVVAARTIDFGDVGGDPLAIGYDLDMRCTCRGDTNSCMRPVWATAEACDGPGGVDNAGGSFISDLAALFDGFGAEAWNEGLEAGDWSLLLRVRDYNGLADDDQVGVDWYVPQGYTYLQDGGNDPPKWDGTDVWPIRAISLQPPTGGAGWDIDKPLNFDNYAYVSGNVLVASMTEGNMQVNDAYAIKFTGAFITAELEERAEGWAMVKGTLAARWTLRNMLAQLSNTDDPLYKEPMCTDNFFYQNVKPKICSYADIYSGVGTPTTPCDSLSIAMSFQSMPARLGTVVESQAEPPRCAPAVDPVNDSCDNL